MKRCNAVTLLVVLALTACRAHAVELTPTRHTPTTTAGAQASATTAQPTEAGAAIVPATASPAPSSSAQPTATASAPTLTARAD